MNIDIQGLLAVAKATEERPQSRFNMGSFLYESPYCGTVCCMIGSFCEAFPEDKLQFTDFVFWLDGVDYNCQSDYLPISIRFGITELEARWLFGVFNYPLDQRLSRNLAYTSKEQALARLYKFIYYKLHKQEMTLEEGRRVSGNLAAPRALEKVS